MTTATVVQYAGYALTILTAAISFYLSRKAGKSNAEALIVAINTLKDEAKMEDGKFSPETIKKAEQFATTIGADDKAIEQVRQALQGKEFDVKLGSYKGKPIYLSKTLGVASLIRNLRKLF